MSIAQWILRVAVATVVVGGAILLTPPFDVNPSCATTDLTCIGDTYVLPDFVWQPAIALFNLNEYIPFRTIMAIVVADLAIRAAMFTWWLAAWTWNKVAP